MLSLVSPSDSLEFLFILFNDWYDRNKEAVTTNGIHHNLLTDWNAISALPRSFKAFKGIYEQACTLDYKIKGIKWRTNEHLQLGPAINRHYGQEIQLFLDWQANKDTQALTSPDDVTIVAATDDVTLAIPDTHSDSDATGSIAPRRIDTNDDSTEKSDPFWRMESDSDIKVRTPH